MVATQFFDRGKIAKALNLTPAIVKNWSDGKPLTITPSLRSEGKRGVQPLYSIEDFYLYALARMWTMGGLTFDAVNKILPQVDKQWFAPAVRGHLLIAQLNSERPLVLHFSKELDEEQLKERLLRKMLLAENHDSHVYKLGFVLDELDSLISKNKGHRANEKKKK